MLDLILVFVMLLKSTKFEFQGPLTALINGKLTVVGIVSFGRTSCTPSVPNGYARVTDQKDWIISNSDAKDYQCIVQGKA